MARSLVNVFFNNNLTVVVAVLLLSSHVKSDLECLNERDSMLIMDSNCFVECQNFPDNKGSYLYFDMVCQVFVRSDKVAGCGSVDRGNEHMTVAKAPRPLIHLLQGVPIQGISKSQQ